MYTYTYEYAIYTHICKSACNTYVHTNMYAHIYTFVHAIEYKKFVIPDDAEPSSVKISQTEI